MAMFGWKDDNKSMKWKMDKYKDNKLNAWAHIYDQYSHKLKNKLESTEKYNRAKNTNYVTKLQTMIQGYCCQINLLSNKYKAIAAAIKNLFYFF
jgi:hypothetical protein